MVSKRNIDPAAIIEAANLGETGKRPPIDQWNPDKVCDIDIRIDREGRWYHEGGEIRRLPMVKLFASILRREDDGQYYLVTPQEKYRIEVEVAPFNAVSVIQDGDRLVMATNLEDSMVLGEEHPLWVDVSADGQPIPYVNVRDRLNALVNRSTFYELVNLAEERHSGDQSTLVIKSAGKEFLLGEL